MKKLVTMLLVLTLVLGIAVSASASVYENQRVRIVIGSTSTSGDSYMTAETVNRYLSKYLGCDSKVDAVGANEALTTIKTADPDGLTFMIFHDMTYIGVIFGKYDETYALENMVVGPRVGQNPGSCFAAKADLPYNNMKEIADYLAANPDEICRIAVEEGGVSHVAYVVFYSWVLENYGEDVASRIPIVVGGSTDVKLQMIWDDTCDVMFADYSSLKQYTEEGVDEKLALKFVGMLDDIPGIEGLPVMKDCGITLGGEPFTFSKDFLIYLPAGVSDEVVAELDAAVAKMAEDPDFIADMKALTYNPSTLPSAEAKAYIYAKRDALAAVLSNAPDFADLVGE